MECLQVFLQSAAHFNLVLLEWSNSDDWRLEKGWMLCCSAAVCSSDIRPGSYRPEAWFAPTESHCACTMSFCMHKTVDAEYYSLRLWNWICNQCSPNNPTILWSNHLPANTSSTFLQAERLLGERKGWYRVVLGMRSSAIAPSTIEWLPCGPKGSGSHMAVTQR
jgi:hypothetical protein